MAQSALSLKVRARDKVSGTLIAVRRRSGPRALDCFLPRVFAHTRRDEQGKEHDNARDGDDDVGEIDPGTSAQKIETPVENILNRFGV